MRFREDGHGCIGEKLEERYFASSSFERGRRDEARERLIKSYSDGCSCLRLVAAGFKLHLRSARMKPVKLGNKPDTRDEDVFPDLAAANELIEK